jgi:hypothetical protein
MKVRRGSGDIDVSQPNILSRAFSREAVTFTLKRMASARDKDNLIAHPLRAAVLIEFEDELSQTISQRVVSGTWSPSASYLCFTNKRSGNYRELVFPTLIDSIVGRRAIDVLEPKITADDNGRVFCGRSHSSSNREPGDYSKWFETWQDYSSKIASAARGEGLAYVFDTDVADFFPSINRGRAKQFLAQRTGAHVSLIELIFYCFEAWLPRFEYAAMDGIPIEPNDISRLVAHNYLKLVDLEFPDEKGCRYVRYVDDSTVFVPDRKTAEAVKRRHHMILRTVGLNPNAAKSEILTVEEYENRRHSEVNFRINKIEKGNDEKAFNALVAEWYRTRNKKTKWDQVAKRLYRAAAKHHWSAMKRKVVTDLKKSPHLTEPVVEYLLQLENADQFIDELLKLWNREEGNTERLIHLARFLCDASFSSKVSERIADFAVGRVLADDDRPGIGYARAVLLLALDKHGKYKHRQKVAQWASVDTLKDEQLRMHFLYVFGCRGELDENLRLALIPLVSSDTDLLLRLCAQASNRKIRRAKKILNRYVRTRGKRRVVEARVLPFVRVLVGSRNDGVQSWIEGLLAPRSTPVLSVRDPVLRPILEELLAQMIR